MKNPSIKNLLLSLCALFAAINSNAHAQLITIHFEGTVNYVSVNAAELLDTGNSFSGSYTYETLTPDTEPNEIAGQYTYAIKDMLFSVGSLSFSNGVDPTNSYSTDSILITNNGFAIDLDLYAAIVPVLDGEYVGIYSASNFCFEMSLLDPTGTVYTNDSLPSELNLASFQNSNQN